MRGIKYLRYLDYGFRRYIPCLLFLITVFIFTASSCAQNSSSPSQATASPPIAVSPASETKLHVVAAENFWGSIAAQLGGDKVQVTSIISNPDADPHDYEPKPTDARIVAGSRYVIFNGAGYDSWIQKLIDANPVDNRVVLDIGALVGKHEGDNPHLWYSPDYVMKAIEQMTADYQKLAPTATSDFAQQKTQYTTVALRDYLNTIQTIRQNYQGTPVGATESMFAYLASALGLNLVTTPEFMNAIAEGVTPTATDKLNFDQQVNQKQIKVLIYNAQNSTPDVEALKTKAQDAGIAIASMTETLTPATASFQEWQTAQLKALQSALEKASK
jgi:zinc/manganese transport system substrate-binding protein